MNFLLANKQIESLNYQLLDEKVNWYVYKRKNVVSNPIVTGQAGTDLWVIVGRVYEEGYQNSASLYEYYREHEISSLLEIDGDFLFICAKSDGTVEAVSTRQGVIPLYYSVNPKDRTVFLSTDCSEIFACTGYSEADIDETAVNDYLRFGTLIGDLTFSKKIKLLMAGSTLCISGDYETVTKRHVLFQYQPENISEEDLIQEITNAYIQGVKKRCSHLEDATLLLSGGMDSRLALAAMNKIEPGAVKTLAFGQDHAEESIIAKRCAEVYQNEFSWAKTNAEDFVNNAAEYIREVSGMDMFPQSYIIKAADQIKTKKFFSGWALGPLLGGTFLDSDFTESDQKLSEIVGDYRKAMKLVCISDEKLDEMLKKDQISKFKEIGIESLKVSAAEFDDGKIENVIDSFAIENRSKRLVLLRMLVPSLTSEYCDVNMDRDVLKAIAKLDVEKRKNHSFYRRLMCCFAKEYVNIPYNNTTLPISAEISYWKEGTRLENEKEKLFSKIMDDYNRTHDEKIYYTHFYSDMNGYSRFDDKWKELFEKYLLNEENMIYKKWFEHTKIREMYAMHMSGAKNYRKELCYLTSLAMFFDEYLK